MRRTRLLLWSTIILAGCSGKGDDFKGGPYGTAGFSEVFVTALVFSDTIYCGYNPGKPYNNYAGDAGGYIKVRFWQTKIITQHGRLWTRGEFGTSWQNHGESEETLAEFKQISANYGNENYNADLYWGNDAYPYKFLSLDIVSDRDFDEAHPAGTSLSDLVRLHCMSFYKFLQGGYEDFDSMSIDKALNELDADDITLISADFGPYLLFSTPPPAGEHTFTVTFRTADKVFWSTCTAVIE